MYHIPDLTIPRIKRPSLLQLLIVRFTIKPNINQASMQLVKHTWKFTYLTITGNLHMEIYISYIKC